jgi:hypothetical protein
MAFSLRRQDPHLVAKNGTPNPSGAKSVLPRMIADLPPWGLDHVQTLTDICVGDLINLLPIA